MNLAKKRVDELRAEIDGPVRYVICDYSCLSAMQAGDVEGHARMHDPK